MTLHAAKNIKELIYWKYAKIMSKSAGIGLTHYRFVWDRFKKLKSCEISMSGPLREYRRESENQRACIYCGVVDGISIDHLIPKSQGGPDIPENAVLACKSCNSSKGPKGLYEWYGKDRSNDIPRIAEGKYLKLLFKLHEENQTMDVGRQDMDRLCEKCKHQGKCPEPLTQLSLESIFGSSS